jgi:hypothetical protein
LTYTKKGSKSNDISPFGQLLTNVLQRSGERGMFKKHEKVGLKQVPERHDGILGLSKTKFYVEERKIGKMVSGDKTGDSNCLSLFRNP